MSIPNTIRFALIITLFSAFTLLKRDTPTLYLIGDSTVDDGTGKDGLWGWGKFLPQFFDTTQVHIRNYAQGGTSTRTFYTGGIWDKKLNHRGLWDTVVTKLKKGDYLLIQFGLNDVSPVDDSTRSRGTLPGIENDSVSIYNKVLHHPEVVHSFGWYLTQFIATAKAKGVTVIVCSTVPRNQWKDGKLIRGEKGFAEWAMQVAQREKTFSIDLNNLIADAYDKEGQTNTTSIYHTSKDNTHTTEAGATLNASIVATSIKAFKKCKLSKYIIK